MEISIYLDKRVHIILHGGFTYLGKVISCDDNSLTLIDKTNSKVTLREDSIEFIKELN